MLCANSVIAGGQRVLAPLCLTRFELYADRLTLLIWAYKVLKAGESIGE
jgi:hypothetical protein